MISIVRFRLHHLCFLPARLAALGAILTLLAVPVSAQEGGAREHALTAEITSVDFDGNETLSTSILRNQITTRETPGFFSKFLHRAISEKLGRKDEYISPFTLGGDLKKLRSFYQQRGFMSVQVDTVLAFSEDGSSVDITFRIKEGYRSLIDTLAYRGVPAAPEAIMQDISEAPVIQKGDPFDADRLEAEVRRVLATLANNGFPNAAFVRDSSSATRFASSGNFRVTLQFDAGRRFLFGAVRITQDTSRGLERREDITDAIIMRHLDFKPGDFYSAEEEANSEKDLNRLGVFDIDSMKARVPSNRDTAITVPIDIVIRAKDKHELAPEISVSNENEAFNLGLGLGYNNRNFMGGARIFGTHARFRTQTLSAFPDYFALDNDAVSNFDLTFDLLQPYVFSNKIKGTWSFSFIVDKEKPYKLNILRNRLGLSDRFAEFTTGQLDWTLEGTNLYRRSIDSALLDPQSQQQLRLLPTVQLNSVLAFTMQRDMSNDIFSPSEGFIHSITLQEAGSIPRIFHLVGTDKFTEFYSVSLLGRWYYDIGAIKRTSIVALKLKVSMEEKYGASSRDTSRSIPPTYRFYAGGSGSVRGWNSRELIVSGDPQFGGALGVEGSVELRFNPLQGLHDGFFDKIWIVNFVDAGNLWPTVRFRTTEVAIAAGIGLRYETIFGPFRIDWGFRVYNPREATDQQWITQRKLFGQTFKEGVFHFGIGQAF